MAKCFTKTFVDHFSLPREISRTDRFAINCGSASHWLASDQSDASHLNDNDRDSIQMKQIASKNYITE
jgi:hypothetical protein